MGSELKHVLRPFRTAAVLTVCFAMSLAAGPNQSDMVTINYPDELPLVGLVDYVSQTLDINILYGEQLKGKKIVLRPASVTLPRGRLLDLLSSALRMEGLALVQEDLEGFYRVVAFSEVQRMASEVRGIAPPEIESLSGRVVTQVINIPSGDTKKVALHLKNFMSSPQASVIEVPERGVIIVTDYEAVLARLVKLVALIDQATEEVSTHILRVRRADPGQLADQLGTILDAEHAQSPAGVDQVQILADVVPGSLVLVATDDQVERIQELMARLDVAPGAALPMRRYAPKHISPKRLSTLIEKLVLGPAPSAAASPIFVDEVAGQLYLTASEGTHQRVQSLLAEVDFPMPLSTKRLRIYRPKNRSAAEIIDTLSQLFEETSGAFADSSALRRSTGLNPIRSGSGNPTTTQVPPAPPPQYAGEPDRVLRIVGPDYVLTQDEHTNTIIAIGAPDFHVQLAELIEALDRRRPQVLIEMTLVAISLTDGLDLGIELQALDLGDGWDYLLSTGFGLSSIDLTTGQRVLSPGLGGTGVLFDAQVMPIIMRALATHGNSRVISMPRIVVTDNATGTIRSVDEAPFTSVNASDTVATTSFGGFESAGTTLTVTPHIAEGDHLNLDYTLTFSNFTGTASSPAAPPPRTTNSFSSILEVPDGYTVVVGGLEIENESDTVSEIPLLGRIPLLGYLFQSSSASRTRSRVFAFIRAVILRDDQFEDLKYITQAWLEEAEVANADFPQAAAMWMR